MPSARKALPDGTPVRTAALACSRVPFWATCDLVAVGDPQPPGVLGRELELLLGRPGTSGPGRPRPRGRPRSAGRCPGASAPLPCWRGRCRRRRHARRDGRRGRRSASPCIGRRRPARARASARRGRRSPRASAPRRRARPRRAASKASALRVTSRSMPARRASSASTAQPARTSPGWAIAIRSRCRRPSGCTTVPSFSAWDSAGKMTVACSRRPSVSTEAWATTSAALCSAALPQRAVGLVADRVGLEQVQRGQLAVGRRRAISAASRPASPASARSRDRRRHSAGLAQAAAVGAGGDLQQPGALVVGQPQALGDAQQRGGRASAPIRSLQTMTTSSPPSRSSAASARELVARRRLGAVEGPGQLGEQGVLAARGVAQRSGRRWGPARSGGRWRWPA